MKRFIALTVVLTAVIGLTIAFAGPEPYTSKEVAPVQPECDWTGWYVGGHIGYIGGNTWWLPSDDLTETETQQDIGGILGGLQLGYNRQINNWFVLGFELTGSYSGIDDSTTFHPDEGNGEVNTDSTQMDWTGTIALRAGFTGMNNKMLFYGKFGAAITHWSYDYLHDETFEECSSECRGEFDRWNEDQVQISPMIGLGMEYMFNCHWSAKVEYNHIFMRHQTIVGTLVEDFESDDQNFGFQFDNTLDSVQFGVNFHF